MGNMVAMLKSRFFIFMFKIRENQTKNDQKRELSYFILCKESK